MNFKICPKCSKKKLSSDFYLRKTGPRSGQLYEKCKECMKFRGRKYYHDNRERQLSLALARRHKAYLEKRKFINKIKDKPCADCGIKYPYYVMDLDHKRGTNKINDVGYMTSRNWSLEKIKREAGKCEVVCANCHRIRTFRKYKLG
jgi:hypothetical protein